MQSYPHVDIFEDELDTLFISPGIVNLHWLMEEAGKYMGIDFIDVMSSNFTAMVRPVSFSMDAEGNTTALIGEDADPGADDHTIVILNKLKSE